MIEENKPKPAENNYIEEDKPSKSQRNVNYKHKKNELKQYTKLLKWEEASKSQIEYLHKFNFKKTTAFKRRFSCHGYGGKCGMCSNNSYGEGKLFFKEDIIYENQKISVCFNKKILGY